LLAPNTLFIAQDDFMTNKLSLAAAVALALANSAAGAASFDDMFSIRGYGTLGVVHSDEAHADFVIDPNTQPKGAGHSDSWSSEVDSKTALQIDAQFTSRLSAVVQLVSESVRNNTWDGDPNETYVPSLEWANLSFKATDSLTVRAGRIALPFLMTAEYRKVGYANQWMRGPVEVYGALPFTSSDGADVSYSSSFGQAINTVRAYYGFQTLRNEAFAAQATVYGLNDTIEMGALTLRAAYLNGVFTAVDDTGIKPTFDGFASLADSVGGQAAANKAREDGNKFTTSYEHETRFFALGSTYDPGHWYVMAELIKLDTDSLAHEYTAGYISGGARIGKFTPYATYAKTKSKDLDLHIPTAGLPAPVAAIADGLNAAILDPTATVDTSQQTIGVGLRWDVAKSIALKAQYDHIELADGSVGLLTNQQPGFEPGGSLNVFGLSVDFVF
jgi:hypothetical protein